MSRRLLLLILVPALVGTMVGVGAATLRPVQPVDAAADAEPAAPADEDFDLGFPREPSGIEPTEIAEAERKRKPRKDRDKQKAEYDVAEVQEQLADLKYYGGPIDGEAGSGFAAAVMAFQKVQGIGADGAVGPQTLAALKDPVTPSLRGGAANRIEVDLTKQVLYFVEDGSLVRIMPVSSGNGATYESGGGTARALTPVGSYAVQRKISGIREAALGTLYDPMYFYQGWAIHGSNSVPAYPASHGCIRVTRADALWLFPRVPVGMSVQIYGGTHTFTAGSDAAGTSVPAGDTAEDTEEPENRDDEGKPAEDGEDKPSQPRPDPEPTEPDDEETEPEEEPSPKPSKSPKPDPQPEPDPEPTVDPTDPPVGD